MTACKIATCRLAIAIAPRVLHYSASFSNSCEAVSLLQDITILVIDQKDIAIVDAHFRVLKEKNHCKHQQLLSSLDYVYVQAFLIGTELSNAYM